MKVTVNQFFELYHQVNFDLLNNLEIVVAKENEPTLSDDELIFLVGLLTNCNFVDYLTDKHLIDHYDSLKNGLIKKQILLEKDDGTLMLHPSQNSVQSEKKSISVDLEVLTHIQSILEDQIQTLNKLSALYNKNSKPVDDFPNLLDILKTRNAQEASKIINDATSEITNKYFTELSISQGEHSHDDLKKTKLDGAFSQVKNEIPKKIQNQQSAHLSRVRAKYAKEIYAKTVLTMSEDIQTLSNHLKHLIIKNVNDEPKRSNVDTNSFQPNQFLDLTNAMQTENVIDHYALLHEAPVTLFGSIAGEPPVAEMDINIDFKPLAGKKFPF